MNRYFGLHTLEGEWHALLPRYLLLSDHLKGKRVLDIGCGSGIGASLLLELGASAVDAIDHRPAVLELARMKHAKPGLDFHVMFWEELNFPEHTFDLVTCFDPSSPVTDPSLITEVRRVLKEDGSYVCAIERRPMRGFERLLPRYGYADAAESIDVHPHDERPPQVGELHTAFEATASVLQRPTLTFSFSGEGDDEPTEGDGRLKNRDGEEPAVEIWFCGGAVAAEPPRRRIELPYFGLVERLAQVHNDLQMRQVQRYGDDGDFFDEIVEPDGSGEDVERDRTPTNEFKVVSFDDEQPTGMHKRPPAGEKDDQLEAQLNELSALYQRVRHDFQNVVSDAQRALQERDVYIEHLVDQVHNLQERFRKDRPSEESLDEMTNVFDEPLAETSDAEDDEPPAPNLGGPDSAAEDDEDSGLGEESSSDGLGEESSSDGLAEESSSDAKDEE